MRASSCNGFRPDFGRMALAGLGAWLLSFAGPAHAAWTELGALEKAGARVSAVAIDLQDLSVIAERNADTRLTPASLTKLPTAAAALEEADLMAGA